MKFKLLVSAALLAIMAGACHKTENSLPLTIDDKAKADSLTYYFGQIRVLEYLHEAESDTTLLEKQTKEEYLRGLRAGLQSIKNDKNAYNQGLFLGMQLAMNMNQFKEEYEVALSPKILMESISKTLFSDSVPDGSEIQREFYRLMNEFNAAKDVKERELSNKAMKEKAEELKMVQLTENLYSKNPKVVKENAFKDGDNVIMNLKVTGPDGSPITSPFPQEVSMGSRLRGNPLFDALESLAPGETGQFITTAGALFGQRSAQLNLKKTDVIVIELSPELIKNEDAQ